MKKILILIFIIALFACEKDDKKGKLDPNAVVSIKPDLSAVSTKAAWHLSNKEIVKQARNISFYNEAVFAGPGIRDFIEAHRDTVNVRLLMWGTDIINQFGEYVTEFIEGRDFVIRRSFTVLPTPPVYDTIAYIPQSVINSARAQIKAAYDDEDFTTVYTLFDNAFKFRPITGAEWRTLKAQGIN